MQPALVAKQHSLLSKVCFANFHQNTVKIIYFLSIYIRNKAILQILHSLRWRRRVLGAGCWPMHWLLPALVAKQHSQLCPIGCIQFYPVGNISLQEKYMKSDSEHTNKICNSKMVWFGLVTTTGYDPKTLHKHRKNCECCHHHSVFKGHNVIVHIVGLNWQKCNQCLKCQVSGHKNFQKIWKLSKHLKHSKNLNTSKIWKLLRNLEISENLKKLHKSENCSKLCKILNCVKCTNLCKLCKIMWNVQNVQS